jgi:glycosyltransferase involved in cell wall biosynthesis
MEWGHRVAGFETPRNQSIAPARGDWILWLDCDEELCNPRAMIKYLRPNIFLGYSLPQHHHSVDPPEATKIDMPIRLFRRIPDPEQRVGWFDLDGWPTFNPGYTCRFTGIVHEHPGLKPLYTEGMFPTISISDAWISHRGYLTEVIRRSRFIRNWPLMAADRMKYPNRRLGDFLWLRDLVHHLRYEGEHNGGMLTPAGVNFADVALELYDQRFVDDADPYQHEAVSYGAVCMATLRKGFEFTATFSAFKPEISPDKIEFQVHGRALDHDQLVRLFKAKSRDVTRWEGSHL